MLAAQHGHVGCVQALVEAGANVDTPDKYNRTALMRAASYGRVECVQVLVQSNAQLNAQDSDGNTAMLVTASAPLLAANARKAAKIYTDIALAIAKGGANLHIENKAGTSCIDHLHTAGAWSPELHAVYMRAMREAWWAFFTGHCRTRHTAAAAYHLPLDVMEKILRELMWHDSDVRRPKRSHFF